MPDGSKAKVKSPSAPAVSSRTIPRSESVSFKVALGTLAPDGSVTVPDSEAVMLLPCAWIFERNVTPMAIVNITKTTKRNLVILPPKILNCWLRI